MDEIKAMQTLATELEKLDDDAKARVLSWANAKFGCGMAASQPTFVTPTPEKAAKPAASPKTKSKGKATKKTKSIIAMNKALNLSPSGKKSAIQFQSEKAPTSVMQKCVVAAYYLREIIEVDAVTVSDVFTFFKTVGWKVPTDLKNTLQQAGTKGWLDTADGEDIKITSMGDNLIEHDLPPKAA
ncbi:MAG: hypothetical protein ABL881_07660 [Novosphingobium sp.]